jgi:hypothetical protein
MILTAQAAASHLLDNAAHFDDLVSLWVIRICCDAIGGVVTALTTSNLSESQISSATALIESTLKQFSSNSQNILDDEIPDPTDLDAAFDHGVNSDDYIDNDKAKKLLACFGLSGGVLTGRIIGNRTDIELTSILAKGEDIYPIKIESGGVFGQWGSSQKGVAKLW